jgi:hypothetical protein
MRVEIFYFVGCPAWPQAMTNVRQALASEELAASVHGIVVTSPADAVAKRFIGSPTIRIDGMDVEGPEAEAQGYGFGCRVYASSGGASRYPSVEQVRLALRNRVDNT